MPSTRNDRVIALLKNLGIDVMEASVRIRKQPATLYRIVNKENEASKATLRILAEALGANYDWLLTGKGEMLVGTAAPAVEAGNNPYELLIKNLTEEKNRLAKEVERLWTIIAQNMQLPPDKAANFKLLLQKPDLARVIQLHTTLAESVRATGTE